MDPHWLEELFERERPRLRAVAYRLLGSPDDADDAVQEAWFRLHRADSEAVENLCGWLTTVVARISVDLLRKRSVRHAFDLDDLDGLESVTRDPSVDAELVDAVSSALAVVLDRLSPPERFAFVLHDVFGVPYEAPTYPALTTERRNATSLRLSSQQPEAVTSRDSLDSFTLMSGWIPILCHFGWGRHPAYEERRRWPRSSVGVRLPPRRPSSTDQSGSRGS
jgi:RNA polymerase sigma-70 factor, ECF subfamily